ncbi:MAG: methyltransferase domain-containing protein [Lewinellaceae bacterium]|nr:methyltransferase domain-containing protein [Lewinellaceae bacterium]
MKKDMGDYSIFGGLQGIDRLEVLSRTVAPFTNRFLDDNQGAIRGRCLDLGCGNGSVTLNMASRVEGRGHAYGFDLDQQNIAYAKRVAEEHNIGNVSFCRLDVGEFQEKSNYNLIYARFLLSHLHYARQLLKSIYQGLVPGGRVLIEDTDFSGHFCFPENNEFQSYVNLYQQLLNKRGADANIGQRLPQMLKEAGFHGITVQIEQPVHSKGEGKLMAELTMTGISEALTKDQIAKKEEIENIFSSLKQFRENENTLMSLPRIVQVTAVKPKQ